MVTSDLASAARAVRLALDDAARGLVDRHVLVDLIALAAVAGEHLLVLGPPGPAKSQAVRRVARALGGRYFEYLLGRFTEPSEIVGPIDLRRLRDGVIETQVAGMLPEAEVAFLDEVFLGSTAILNTLLSLLNERTFRRGATALAVPLRVCVGAANQLPDDESLAAFADRFLLRAFVAPVGDAQLEELLEGGWQVEHERGGHQAQLADIDRLATAARAATLVAIRPALAEAIRTLRGAGITLSDRRVVKLQRLVAAAAALDGRAEATTADLLADPVRGADRPWSGPGARGPAPAARGQRQRDRRVGGGRGVAGAGGARGAADRCGAGAARRRRRSGPAAAARGGGARDRRGIRRGRAAAGAGRGPRGDRPHAGRGAWERVTFPRADRSACSTRNVARRRSGTGSFHNPWGPA